jgi:hypothetical protein
MSIFFGLGLCALIPFALAGATVLTFTLTNRSHPNQLDSTDLGQTGRSPAEDALLPYFITLQIFSCSLLLVVILSIVGFINGLTGFFVSQIAVVSSFLAIPLSFLLCPPSRKNWARGFAILHGLYLVFCVCMLIYAASLPPRSHHGP